LGGVGGGSEGQGRGGVNVNALNKSSLDGLAVTWRVKLRGVKMRVRDRGSEVRVVMMSSRFFAGRCGITMEREGWVCWWV